MGEDKLGGEGIDFVRARLAKPVANANEGGGLPNDGGPEAQPQRPENETGNPRHTRSWAFHPEGRRDL